MRVTVLAVLLVATAWPAGDPDFHTHLVSFHNHFNRFFRMYLGCPAKASDVEQCHPMQGVLDKPEFERAAREARILFR